MEKEYDLRQSISGKFMGALGFSLDVYQHSLNQLPSRDLFNDRQVKIHNGSFFADYEMVLAYEVELSWAFLVRVSSQFEAYLSRIANLEDQTFNKAFIDSLYQKANLSHDEVELVSECRELRNILTHGDGDHTILRNTPSYFPKTDEGEPQIYRDYVERYAQVCRKLVQASS